MDSTRDPDAPFGIPEDELLEYRESIAARDHDLYVEQDNWSTVDIDAVDNIFVASMDPNDGNQPARIGPSARIRIDLDGVGSSGDIIERGKNVQSSIWLTETMAEKLYHEIGSALNKR